MLHLPIDDIVTPPLLRIGRPGGLGDQGSLANGGQRVAQLVGECGEKLILASVRVTPVALLVQLSFDLPLHRERMDQLLTLALQGRPGDRKIVFCLPEGARKRPRVLHGSRERSLRFVAI